MSVIDIDRPEVTDEGQATDRTAPPTTVTRPTAEPTLAHQAAPNPSPRPPRRRLFADLGGPLSRSWGIALAVAWIVVVAVGLAVEPAPANPDAPVPLLADILSTGLMVTWGAMAAGIFQGRRFAAAASLAGGVGLLALTVACPASGHHGGIGAWWGVQMVGVVALLALSGRALRRS